MFRVVKEVIYGVDLQLQGQIQPWKLNSYVFHDNSIDLYIDGPD